MEKYHLTPEALSDLFEIWDYIAQDNPAAADRVQEAVFRACDLLADSPLAGRVRKNLTPLPVRFWGVGPYSKYLIVYDPEKKPLQIIRCSPRCARSSGYSGLDAVKCIPSLWWGSYYFVAGNKSSAGTL